MALIEQILVFIVMQFLNYVEGHVQYENWRSKIRSKNSHPTQPHLTSPHPTHSISPHLTPSHPLYLTQPHPTSPHPTLPHPTPPHPTSPHPTPSHPTHSTSPHPTPPSLWPWKCRILICFYGVIWSQDKILECITERKKKSPWSLSVTRYPFVFLFNDIH